MAWATKTAPSLERDSAERLGRWAICQVRQLPAGNLCPYSITQVNSLRTTARRPAVALEERGVDGGQHGQQRAPQHEQRWQRQAHDRTAPVIACCILTGNKASHVSAIVWSQLRASVPGWLTGPRV